MDEREVAIALWRVSGALRGSSAICNDPAVEACAARLDEIAIGMAARKGLEYSDVQDECICVAPTPDDWGALTL